MTNTYEPRASASTYLAMNRHFFNLKRRLWCASLPKLDAIARRFGARVQYSMDIETGSHWFPHELVARFGGFNPPTERRNYVKPFPGDQTRSDVLVLLLREITIRHVPGCLAELGVHRGDSARLVHHYCPERKLYLFDTYTGFSAADLENESIKTSYNQTTAFADTSVATVLNTVAPKNDNVVPVIGWFPASIPSELNAQKFALVHLDADLEAPTAAGLNFFWPRLSCGGYIVVHDYNAWPGARIAVDEFRQLHAVPAVPIPDKSGSIVLVK